MPTSLGAVTDLAAGEKRQPLAAYLVPRIRTAAGQPHSHEITKKIMSQHPVASTPHRSIRTLGEERFVNCVAARFSFFWKPSINSCNPCSTTSENLRRNRAPNATGRTAARGHCGTVPALVPVTACSDSSARQQNRNARGNSASRIRNSATSSGAIRPFVCENISRARQISATPTIESNLTARPYRSRWGADEVLHVQRDVLLARSAADPVGRSATPRRATSWLPSCPTIN